MTREEVKQKWASTHKMIALTDDEKACKTPEDRNSAIVKTKLRIAVYYLKFLDEHDCEYQVPFTGDQFKWALRKPIGDNKKKQATKWCHQCAELRDSFCGGTL